MTRKEKMYWEPSHRIIVDFLKKLNFGVDLPYSIRFYKEIIDIESGRTMPMTIIIYGNRSASIKLMTCEFDDTFAYFNGQRIKYNSNIPTDFQRCALNLACYLKAHEDDIVREIKDRIEYLQSVLS